MALRGLRQNSRHTVTHKQMAGAMGDSIPLACQDWANTVSGVLVPPFGGIRAERISRIA